MLARYGRQELRRARSDDHFRPRGIGGLTIRREDQEP